MIDSIDSLNDEKLFDIEKNERNRLFPVIENIENILEALSWKEKKFGSSDEFLVKDSGKGYISVHYMLTMSDTFPSPEDMEDERSKQMSLLLRECRGLKFDSKTKNIIARPYHKFFNVGEKPETRMEKIDFGRPHKIMEKLDGSMLYPIFLNNSVIWCTKSGISEQSIKASKFIESDEKRKKSYFSFAEKCLKEGYTPLFEWCDPEEPIVVRHDSFKVVLTGIRNMLSGEYVSYERMKSLAEDFGFPAVESFSDKRFSDEGKLNEIMEKIRTSPEDMEGIVVRFDSGEMLKVKTEKYVSMHSAKNNLFFEKNVVKLILDNVVDDVVSLLPEKDADALRRFSSDFVEQVEKIVVETTAQALSIMNESVDKKDFSAKVNRLFDPRFHCVHYKIFDVVSKKSNFGESHKNDEKTIMMESMETARETIYRIINKNTGSATKLETVRFIFGGISWKNYFFSKDQNE